MNAKPFTFWIRKDLDERLRLEPNMAKVLNNLLAVRYNLPLDEPDDKSTYKIYRFCLTFNASRGMNQLQLAHRWSKDHVIELSIRHALGMEPPRKVRFTRRISVRVVCQTQTVLPADVASALDKAIAAHPNKATATGHLISGYILEFAKHFADMEAGL